MQNYALRFSLFLTIGLLLVCCGCPTPTPNGGDPPVWHDMTINGSAEIMSVNFDAADGTEISIQFTYEDGRVDEKQVDGLKLASINDLPDGYKPQLGDTIRLRLDLRYKRKMSVGPPDFLHSKIDSRKFTCQEVVKSETQSD